MYVCTAAALLSALCSVGKRSQHHTGTQLSSSQRPHSPQAQHSLIPAHQMLCSDWQCCKTPGIASLRMRCARPRDGCAGCTSSLGHKRGVRQCHLAPPVPLAGDTQLHGCPFQTCASPSQLCLCNSHSPKYDEFAHHIDPCSSSHLTRSIWVLHQAQRLLQFVHFQRKAGKVGCRKEFFFVDLSTKRAK